VIKIIQHTPVTIIDLFNHADATHFLLVRIQWSR